MDKREKLYRLKKAYNTLYDYTTLNDDERLERVVEELLKVLESIVEEIDN